MAVTTNQGATDRPRETPRSARREMVEGLLLLAILIMLAVVSRLPSG